jgi:hypothetical protein
MLFYANELLEIAQRTKDATALLFARRARSSVYFLQGRLSKSHEETQLVMRLYQERQDKIEDRKMARDPKVSTHINFGICLTALGFPDSGAAMTLEGIKLAEILNHTVSLILALRRACVRAMMQLDTREVLNLSQRLLALNTNQETFVGTREGTIFNGWAQLQSSPDSGLFERILTSLEELDAAKHQVMLPFFMASVAELMYNHGNGTGARALLDRAAELASVNGEQWCDPEIIRLRARFNACGSHEALATLQASLASAKEQGSKLWELRTSITLAEHWLAAGDRTAARKVLAPVYGWFTEGFNTRDLVAARKVLGQLDG